MKFGKKAASLCALVIGVCLLATSAFADVMLGSGYNSLKDAAKSTAAQLSDGIDNFTSNVTMALKVDGQVVDQSDSLVKYDNKNMRMESTESHTSVDKDAEGSNYYYRDSEKYISKHEGDDTYYLSRKSAGIDYGFSDGKLINNPFEEEEAKDVEKVIDAFVGSLKDVVQVEETDGKKMYVANLTQAQIPAFANALVSFGVKYSFMDSYHTDRYGIPALTEDIYVKEGSAKAIENENGIIDSVVGSVNLTGTDKDGVVHEIVVEVSATLTDINNTVVTEPDLTDKKVEEGNASGREFDERFVGTYKNNITKMNEAGIEKIGERVLEITSVTDKGVAGRYYETRTDGGETNSFDFAITFDDENYNHRVTYTDANGEERSGMLHRNSGDGSTLMFELNVEDSPYGGYSIRSEEDFNNSFTRVFE